MIAVSFRVGVAVSVCVVVPFRKGPWGLFPFYSGVAVEPPCLSTASLKVVLIDVVSGRGVVLVLEHFWCCFSHVFNLVLWRLFVQMCMLGGSCCAQSCRVRDGWIEL